MPVMLNTKEYLNMRNEAFANDGLTPSSDPFSSAYAPDLWFGILPSNFSKMMLGRKSHIYNGQIRFQEGLRTFSFS